MADLLLVDLFCEDDAQAELVTAIARRVYREEGFEPEIRVRCRAGGHGAVLRELRRYAAVKALTAGMPDVLLGVVDEDGQGSRDRTRYVADELERVDSIHRIPVVPVREIEDWYVLDIAALAGVFGRTTTDISSELATGSKSAMRRLANDDSDNNLLGMTGDADDDGGLAYGVIAHDLVRAWDCDKVMRGSESLRDFCDELRRTSRSLRVSREQ